jgi:very-short-patch-repair endonuclease
MKVWPQKPNLGKSELEAILLNRLERAGLPVPRVGYHFALPERRWAFDLAWPEQRLAVEVEGGGFVQGRHVRGAGYAADCSKYNAATLRGWRVLRFTGRMIEQGDAVRDIRAALEGE